MIEVRNRDLIIPTSGEFVGVAGDNKIEVRQFVITDPKLFGFDFKLDVQQGENKNIIDLDKTVETDKIILSWVVKKEHIPNSGILYAQLRAFSQDEEIWHSKKNYFNIGGRIGATDYFPSPLPNEFEEMEQRVTVAKNAAEEAAQTATEQADRVQDIVDYAETEVLPALNQAVEDAGQAKDLLDGSIEAAGTANTQLSGTISAAGTAKIGLEGTITQANTVKGQLDGSITQAGTKKTELDGSISTAGQIKEDLDESIATGDLVTFKGEFQSHLTDYANLVTEVNKKASKQQGEWIQATLLNGWTGSVKYSKNSLNMVSVYFFVYAGTTALSTPICEFAIGFRPIDLIAIYAENSSTGTYCTLRLLSSGAFQIRSTVSQGNAIRGYISFYTE